MGKAVKKTSSSKRDVSEVFSADRASSRSWQRIEQANEPNQCSDAGSAPLAWCLAVSPKEWLSDLWPSAAVIRPAVVTWPQRPA